MGQIRVVRCLNAERVAYGGIEIGRMFYCTDTEVMWMGTASGDAQVSPGGSYTFWDPDALPDTPSAQDDHFSDASLAVKWTEWDLGAAALTVSEAGHHAILAHATEGAGRWRGIYQTLPAGEFTVVMKASGIASSLGDSATALALFEDATNINADVVVLMNFQRASGNLYRDIYAQRWSDYQTFSSNYSGGTIYPNTTCYLRIRRDAGNALYYDYSSDGVSWQRIFTHAEPFTPAEVGIVTQNNNSGITIYGYFDLFRYIASDEIGPIGKVRTVFEG